MENQGSGAGGTVLRVCLLAPEFLPNRGGVGTYSVELAKELSRRVELTILTLTRTDRGRSYNRQEMEDALDHQATIYPIAEAGDGFVYNARFQYAVLRDLPRRCRSERFDLIHTQHAHMPDLLSGLLGHQPPLVRTVHSTIRGQRDAIRVLQGLGEEVDRTERWEIGLEPLLRLTERSVLRRPGPLIAVSDWTRQQLLDDGLPDDRIRVIHNGVDTQRFRPEAAAGLPEPFRSERPRVLLPGRLTLLKGGAVALAAIPSVVAAVPDVEFAFTGGTTKQMLELLSPGRLPWDHLRLLGTIEYEQLPSVIASSDVIMLPTFYDNCPFAVLEGMASGVPVVASSFGGIPEAIHSGANGLLVPTGDAHALSQALVRLLTDAPERRRLGANARRTMTEQFGWNTVVDQTMSVYTEALAS